MHVNRRQIIGCLSASVAVLLVIGCDIPMIAIGSGYADFSAKLVGNYSVYRTSAHQIMVTPESWDNSTPVIPTKVIECAIDRHFVLAKRQGLKRRSPNNPNDTYEEPDPSVFDYWVLDTSAPRVFGPMTQHEFDAKRQELGVVATIALKDVYSFRP